MDCRSLFLAQCSHLVHLHFQRPHSDFCTLPQPLSPQYGKSRQRAILTFSRCRALPEKSVCAKHADRNYFCQKYNFVVVRTSYYLITHRSYTSNDSL